MPKHNQPKLKQDPVLLKACKEYTVTTLPDGESLNPTFSLEELCAKNQRGVVARKNKVVVEQKRAALVRLANSFPGDVIDWCDQIANEIITQQHNSTNPEKGEDISENIYNCVKSAIARARGQQSRAHLRNSKSFKKAVEYTAETTTYSSESSSPNTERDSNSPITPDATAMSMLVLSSLGPDQASLDAAQALIDMMNGTFSSRSRNQTQSSVTTKFWEPPKLAFEKPEEKHYCEKTL